MTRTGWPRVAVFLALILISSTLFAAPRQTPKPKVGIGFASAALQALDRLFPLLLKARGTMDPNGSSSPLMDARGTMDPDGATASETDARGTMDPNG